jgi:NADH:ubiquinone oxidoreductase subunit 2 (subunit N)
MDFDKLAGMAAKNELVPALAATFVGTGYSGVFLLGAVAVCVFLGLAVKLPVFPFHAWLPAAYAEAPTPVTILLTGLLSKMGVYGLLRILLPIFPEVLPALVPALMTLAVITVVLGAVAALAQKDLKRILAYSSVNHLGYCAMAVLAVAVATTDRDAQAAAISGTILQAFNHGIIASTIFSSITPRWWASISMGSASIQRPPEEVLLEPPKTPVKVVERMSTSALAMTSNSSPILPSSLVTSNPSLTYFHSWRLSSRMVPSALTSATLVL